MDEIKKQNNINHKKTFAAGIILLVMAFIYLLCFAFVLYVFITSRNNDQASSLGEALGLIVVILIKILFSIVGLPVSFILMVKYTIFGVLSIINSKKEDISTKKMPYVYLGFAIASEIAITIIYITIIINGGLKGTLIALPIWAVISLVQVLVSIFLISDKKVINN